MTNGNNKEKLAVSVARLHFLNYVSNRGPLLTFGWHASLQAGFFSPPLFWPTIHTVKWGYANGFAPQFSFGQICYLMSNHACIQSLSLLLLFA